MTDRFDLAGHTALVTGAGSGLGRGFAEVLAAAGARVVLCGRRRGPLDHAARAIAAAGGQAVAVPMDVTDAESVRAGFDAAQTRYSAVDIAVCNAGTAITGRALELDDSAWQRTLEVNLHGSRRVAVEAAKRLKAAGQPGSIVTVTSILAARVAAAVAPYAASKAALEQLTRSLALEFARYDIRVNALAPGYIATDMNREFFETKAGRKMIERVPQRRLGAVDDLAGALLLLASNASRYMTGATVAVDGGHLCSSL